MSKTLSQYQTEAMYTAQIKPKHAKAYSVLGLNDEAGEVAGAYKKYLRGDFGEEELIKRIKKELGDVMWYLAYTASVFDLTLDEIASENIRKLQDRQERGEIRGDGDER